MTEDRLGCIVAEADEEYRTAVSAVAGRAGLRVVTVGRGADAIGAAESGDIALVLLSLDLPDTSIPDLCREFRRIYYQRPLQIVLMSPDWDSGIVEPSMDSGADDVMKKPTEEAELLIRIRTAMQRFESQALEYDNREFYRQAAKQEEELSSRVLDQNLDLKRAYQHIEIANQRLERTNRELKRVARYDILSGLMNRMSLFTMIDIEVDRAIRTRSQLCGIMIDIDHFKMVNDYRGHQCGDAVIRMIGDTLKQELRKYDHAGRYGGEEFFILLPDTSLEQARRFGERIRAALEEKRVDCEDAETSITASLGISQFRAGESREMWISRADRAMYAAKQRGRNRVETENALAY